MQEFTNLCMSTCEHCKTQILDSHLYVRIDGKNYHDRCVRPANPPRDTVNIASTLKQQFPGVDANYIAITLSELQLFSDKNHDYAKGGSTFGNFERSSEILKLYPNFPYNTREGVCILYLLKQFDAVLHGMAQGLVHKVEGLDTRIADIVVYLKILRCMLREKKGEKEI